MHIGAVTYFKNGILQFYWRDPPAGEGNAIYVPLEDKSWRYYYEPAVELIRNNHEPFRRMLERPSLVSIKEADIEIGIRPDVLRAIDESDWGKARMIAQRGYQEAGNIAPAGAIQGRDPIPYRVDGIAVIAGPAWGAPFSDQSTVGRQS